MLYVIWIVEVIDVLRVLGDVKMIFVKIIREVIIENVI